jgi:hypothetical protein
VEHPCHRCGSAVEDGILFCQNCGAPQIRVPSSEPVLDVERSEVSGNSEPATLSLQSSHPILSDRIDWSDALRAALLCGFLEAVFSLFGLGIIAGGALSVALYRRRQSEVPVSVSMGARLGAISGGMAWLFLTLITTIGALAFRTGDQIRQLIFQSMEQAAARNPTVQAQELMQYVKTQDGFAVMLALILFMTLFFFVVLSTLGGMLGSTLFSRRTR